MQFVNAIIEHFPKFYSQATSAGLKEQEAINFLEKKMKNDPKFSYEETVQVNKFLRVSIDMY